MTKMTSEAEEDLRYFSSIGDEEGVQHLISQNVGINSRNSMNGWSALHWAALRGHSKIVEILLHNGANPRIENFRGETPANLTDNVKILNLLGENSQVETRIPQLPITPSYLKYPPLPVSNLIMGNFDKNMGNQRNTTDNCKKILTTNELILKVRVADSEDPDFIEIGLNKEELTIDKLVIVCCDELEISKNHIIKIRKLPNTVIRKDKDVERLQPYQELEIILCN